jgi:endonuclease G
MDAPTGYDADFLAVELPLPPTDQPTRRLDYTHFSVLLHPERRLAAATAVNIDGAALVDLGRGDDWHLDDRVPASEQVGEELYARNDLDRGHLVRRRDPVWGADAARANFDTFVFTNAAPQAADFNQSKELWLGLEDYLLGHADAYDRRLTVFTGPVFAGDDPTYRGVRIPRRFWKVAAWADAAGPAAASPDDTGAGLRLAATAYVLDQTAELDDIDVSLRAGGPPPLGPFRTFQVPVADVARLTGLALGELVAADVLRGTAGARPGTGWIPLVEEGDIRLPRAS